MKLRSDHAEYEEDDKKTGNDPSETGGARMMEFDRGIGNKANG